MERKLVGAVIAVVFVLIGLVAVSVHWRQEPGVSEAGDNRGTTAPANGDRTDDGSEPRPRDRRREDTKQAESRDDSTSHETDEDDHGPVPFRVDGRVKEIIARHSRWNPPRPFRLLVQVAHGRSRAEARARAEEARRRFLDGESPYRIIRELSDPPSRIPAALAKQYAGLRPTEASPVLETDQGFVVFFGTPDHPPTPEELGTDGTKGQ